MLGTVCALCLLAGVFLAALRAAPHPPALTGTSSSATPQLVESRPMNSGSASNGWFVQASKANEFTEVYAICAK